MTFLEELVDGLWAKIQPLKHENFSLFVSLGEDHGLVREKYEKLLELHEVQENFLSSSMSGLLKIGKNCKNLFEEMTSQMAEWSVPQEPLLTDEDKEDFFHYSAWLFEYIQYLLCLKNSFEDPLEQYGNYLYGLQKEVSDSVRFYRNDYTRREFWEKSIKLRGQIYKTRGKMENIMERYYKAKSEEGEKPVEN